MIDIALISLFIPTFFLVSITPGMCMTLAMTLGMSIGVKKTMWMMWGELLGVASVAIASVVGISSMMLKVPVVFHCLKIIGALYLFYIGFNMWRSKGKLALAEPVTNTLPVNKKHLFNQGFITAIANPKGWAFMVSLLPPFINNNYALPSQLTVLVAIIIVSEFICMMIYATGGRSIARILIQEDNVKILNKISGSLMIAVAIWLVLS
ncbi:LysE family translocator [Thalassotalea castellviae]|uniref:LysE family translocator n=1 Tax=Thalassotalea castellviae TaxID=3075612 RepID=A0ABU2ZVX8_9GAMM|nr:LysE family translocator [Thalassotalea sp. W431]MDT0602092.1 LysE family translocator [Thalassotalea sp. W431]